MSENKAILIIEDEINLLSSLKDALEVLDEKPIVYMAVNAAQALNIIDTKHLDLIISDIRLPQMDGITLISEMRNRKVSANIIMMTAYGSRSIREKALEAGAIGYIEKPFELSEFVDLVLKYLEPSGFKGTGVDGMNLFDLLQFIEISQKSILIKLKNKFQETGELYFEEGNILHAKTKVLTGEKAFFKIITWQEGNITSTKLPEQFPKSIDTSTSFLVMEAMRIKDENSRKTPNQDLDSQIEKLDDNNIFETITNKIDSNDVDSSNLSSNNPNPNPKEIIMNLQELQTKLKNSMNGFVACAVVDVEQGMPLAGEVMDPSTDLSIPSGYFTETFKSSIRSLEAADWGLVDEVLISGKTYNLILISLKGGTYYQGITFHVQTPLGMVRAIFKKLKPEVEAALP